MHTHACARSLKGQAWGIWVNASARLVGSRVCALPRAPNLLAHWRELLSIIMRAHAPCVSHDAARALSSEVSS